jgi:hypothetical protein
MPACLRCLACIAAPCCLVAWLGSGGIGQALWQHGWFAGDSSTSSGTEILGYIYMYIYTESRKHNGCKLACRAAVLPSAMLVTANTPIHPSIGFGDQFSHGQHSRVGRASTIKYQRMGCCTCSTACRVGMENPTIRVRYSELSVLVRLTVGDRSVPSLSGTVSRKVEVRVRGALFWASLSILPCCAWQ